MVLHLDLDTHRTREDILGFLEGTAEGNVLIPDREEAYEHIGRVLRRFSYWRLGKPDKGLVKRYLERTTGLSRAQLPRLVKRYLATGELGGGRRGAGRRFPRKYRPEDIELLAETDELHGTLSGPATLAICKRAWDRLASSSPSGRAQADLTGARPGDGLVHRLPRNARPPRPAAAPAIRVTGRTTLCPFLRH